MEATPRKPAIRINNISKRYRLGQIGGGTLHADVQSWWALKRGKEDPNVKIGQEVRLRGTTFMALNGINLEVPRGQALGIIGKNGAGKSTLLKLISRITAPTSGNIELYGRVASMLEVGTGFNGEMTGRENIYLNGAILGMTKEEIDRKMEDIIEFSEVRDYIDTPMKRYSSGMYVKLAFSVAAHLESEIMIMDEVLAVGDVVFQRKCLEKMWEAVTKEGRTVLYVSHNMNTIRQLCDRCIVLDDGKIVYDGDVEQAIETYAEIYNTDYNHIVDLDNRERHLTHFGNRIRLRQIRFLNNEKCALALGEDLCFHISLFSQQPYDKVCLRLMIYYADDTPIAMGEIQNGEMRFEEGLNSFDGTLGTKGLAPGKYYLKVAVYLINEYGIEEQMDILDKVMYFVVVTKDTLKGMGWLDRYWGHVFLPMSIRRQENMR